MCGTTKVAALILVLVNFFIMFTCVIAFSCGLWIIASPETISGFLNSIGNTTIKALFPREVITVQLGVGLAVVSAFLFFVAFMGFYGAITRSQFSIFMYSSLILLLLLLECALIFYFTSSLVEKGLQESDGQWSHAVRLLLKCCEHNHTTLNKLPWSCCGADYYPDSCGPDKIFKKDCVATVSTWLDHYQNSLYVSVAALHILLLACSLIRRSGRRFSSKS